MPSFYAFLGALEDPKHHDHDEVTDWYGGPFDPNALDETKSANVSCASAP
ncbi:MAG: hypothetical protein ABSC64_20070 [Candidatus Korobacteraceae bacterium]